MNKTGMVVFFMLFSVGFFANTVFSADLSIGNDTLINVVSDVSLPELKPLRSYPNAIPISTPTDVFFSFILANSDIRPSKVSVQQTDENGIYIKETGNLV
ncbi:hypothetical protein LJC22_07590, partial [Desulfosarcina sp. OttesenSCG-928-G10]|nr:hypothetical protein [Desulfosarcina sp. OttesenSCG-928-G10]